MKKSNLLDFFKYQNEVNKISCPACNTLLVKSKLNEHLDFYCTSAAPRQSTSKIKFVNKSVRSPKKKKTSTRNFTSRKLNLKSQLKIPEHNNTAESDSEDEIVILSEIPASSSKLVKKLNEQNSDCSPKSIKELKQNLEGIVDLTILNSKELFGKTNSKIESESNKLTLHNKHSAETFVSCSLRTEELELCKLTTSSNQKEVVKLNRKSKRCSNFLELMPHSKVIRSENFNTEKNLKTDDCINTQLNYVVTDNVHVIKGNKYDNDITKVKGKPSSENVLDVNYSEKSNIDEQLTGFEKCFDDNGVFSELSDTNENDNNKSPEAYTPYYIANFKHILEVVLNDEDKKFLFNDEDMVFVNSFNSLSDVGQKIYVRLFQRKYKWLRIDKIKYPNITSNSLVVLEELNEAGLVESGSSDIDLETAIDLLSLPEAKSVAKHFNFNSGKNKTEIKEMILKHSKQHKSVFFTSGQNGISNRMLKKIRQTIGPCYKLSLLPKRLFTRILMLFNLPMLSEDDDDAAAGGQQQQLLTLLQINKGELSFPDYKQTKEIPIFIDRDELIRYEEARQLENDIMNTVECKKFEEAKELYLEAKEEYEDQCTKHFESRASSLPVYLKKYTSFHVYIRCMTQGVEILQKLRQYKEAVSLLRRLLKQKVFCQDYKGRWYDRLALNLEQHLKKPQEALEEIKNALEDNNVRVGHRYSLLTRALRITKTVDDDEKFRKLLLREADIIEAPKVTIKGRLCPRSILGRRHVFISSSSALTDEDDVTVLGVEQLALEHYKEQGYSEGIHGEGSTFISLYALLFWDIIYDGNIPDVFICPYQTHPLDLNSDAFFLNREQEITSHLQMLKFASQEELKEIVKVTWENNHGKSSLVAWDRFTDLEHVLGLVCCMDGSLLSGICERLAKDFRFTRSGVPDLVVWDPATLKVKIVEVKGPGDKLSSKQILWLDYLIKLGADAEVCLVEAVAAKKLQK